MAKTVKVKSELKQEKNSAFLLSLLFKLLSIILFAASFYMLFLYFDNKETIPIGVIIAVFLFGVIFLVLNKIKHKKYMILRSGVVGENSVLSILKKLPSDYTVVTNPVIHNRGKYNELDFVVISKDAVFTVETKNYKGALKGLASSKELTQVKYGKGGSIYEKTVKNPVWQAETQGRRMRDLLYDVKIPYTTFSVLYFVNEIELNITNDREYDCAVIANEAELIRFLRNTHGKTPTNSAQNKKLVDLLKR